MSLHSKHITNIAEPIFTSANSTNAITVIYICNASTNSVLFNLFAVPSGNTASYTNVIYYNVPLTVNDTYVLDTEKLILEPGDSIYANLNVPIMTANIKVIATVSSIEV